MLFFKYTGKYQEFSLRAGTNSRRMRILVVEDNPGDIRLLKEAIDNAGIPSHVDSVDNGEDAIAFLRQQGEYTNAKRPDLVLLDLNLPRKDGRDVLAHIKDDVELRRIPVVVLTTSQSDSDVHRVYDLHANCYIQKPVDLDEYMDVIQACENFWFKVVRLPSS